MYSLANNLYLLIPRTCTYRIKQMILFRTKCFAHSFTHQRFALLTYDAIGTGVYDVVYYTVLLRRGTTAGNNIGNVAIGKRFTTRKVTSQTFGLV